jgi:hypothetical protein
MALPRMGGVYQHSILCDNLTNRPGIIWDESNDG